MKWLSTLFVRHTDIIPDNIMIVYQHSMLSFHYLFSGPAEGNGMFWNCCSKFLGITSGVVTLAICNQPMLDLM